jgi:protein TonB
MVAALAIPRYVPVHLTGQPTQAIVSDGRNLSLSFDQKVSVENAPPPPARPSKTPVSGGVLNGAAVSLPAPVYPETVRRMGVSGAVEVEVVIDENGKVASAKAISGPSSLRDSAVRAALRARFTPSTLSGQPVQVTGKIVYKFAPFQ